MREIEFRAYLKKNKQIVEVLDIDFMQETIGYMNKSDTKYTCAKFDDIELMQYTGLKDKNCKLIFEGDIVDIHSKAYRSVVEFGRHSIDCCGCCYDKHDTIGFYFTGYNEDEETFDNIEVVGNIWDNPELTPKN